MSIVLLFALLLIVSFVVLLYFLKPTSTEKAVARQLAEIEKSSSSTSSVTILKQESLRSNPIADAFISRLPWSQAVRRLILQAGKDWQVGAVSMLSVTAGLGVGLIAAWASTAVIGIAFGLVAALSPYAFLYIVREARRRRFAALLPEAVDLMSRGLRAGHSIAAVLEMVGKEIADPVGKEFRSLHEQQAVGLPIRDAMMNLVERMPLDDMRFLATAILLQKESGGNLAQILDKTAAVVRERARLRGQLQIYTAQGRITGWILCAAPFLMFALLSVVNHDYEKTLFSTSMGLWMVYAGLGAMVLGILVIRKIIDVKV